MTLPALTLIADVTFSDPALAIVGSLLAALAAVIRMLWSQEVKQRDDQLRDMTAQRDKLMKVIVDCHMRHQDEMHGRGEADESPPGGTPGPPAGGTGH